MEKNLIDLIPTGSANAISAAELASLTRQDKRQMRREIEELRGKGVLICSRCDKAGGYYLPADDGEVSDYLSRQLSRVGHIWRALAPFKRHVKDSAIAEQLDFWASEEDGHA